MNRTALAVAAAAITGVQVGAAITATRYVAGEISPASLAFLRYAIGVACLVPAILLAWSSAPTVPQPPPPHSPSKTGVNALSLGEVDRPQAGREGVSGTSLRGVPPPQPSPASGGGRSPPAWHQLRLTQIFAARDILPIALLGIAQFGVLIALLNYGLKTVPAGRGALILASFPLLTLIFAALLGHERITLTKFAGILLTLVGVAFALGDKIVGSGTLSGEIAILMSAVTGALCSVLYRPYLRRYPTLPVSAFAMAAAAAALLAPAALDDLFVAPVHLGAGAWVAIVFIGFSSAGGYVLWLWALKIIAATRVTVFLALSPITAAALGVALLGEPLTAGMIAGVVCVAAGLWVANWETPACRRNARPPNMGGS